MCVRLPRSGLYARSAPALTLLCVQRKRTRTRGSSPFVIVSPEALGPFSRNARDPGLAREACDKADAPTSPAGVGLRLSSGHLDRRASRRPRQNPAYPGSVGMPSQPPGRRPRNAGPGGQVSARRPEPRAVLFLPPGSTRRHTRPRRDCDSLPTKSFAVRRPPEDIPLTLALPGRSL